MKSSLFTLTFLSVLVVLVNLFYNIPINLSIFGLISILLLYTVSYFRKEKLFLLFSIILFIFLFQFLINSYNVVTVFTSFVILMFYCYSFNYAFNLFSNSYNVKFKNIVIPDNKEYLVIKYINGPMKEVNHNGIIVKENDSFIIYVEDRKIVDNFQILIENIRNIDIKEKPYMKSKIFLPDYSNDNKKYHGNFERARNFKLIPAYYINIYLKDNSSIKIISFDEPKMF